MRCKACDRRLSLKEQRWSEEFKRYEDLCSKCLTAIAEVDSEKLFKIFIDSAEGEEDLDEEV